MICILIIKRRDPLVFSILGLDDGDEFIVLSHKVSAEEQKMNNVAHRE